MIASMAVVAEESSLPTAPIKRDRTRGIDRRPDDRVDAPIRIEQQGRSDREDAWEPHAKVGLDAAAERRPAR